VQRNLEPQPLQRPGVFRALGRLIFRKRFRVALPVAFMAAFLLVPAAQAAANGTLTVHLEGSGSGEVSSVGGYAGGGIWEGDPPIECSGPPEDGTCETELVEEPSEPGLEAISLHWSADPGSEVAAVVVNEGTDYEGVCEGLSSPCLIYQETGAGNADVTVYFEPASTPEFPLTVTKSGTGTGNVTSSPAGIDCGSTCSADFAEGTTVTLTPAADSGSQFVEWTGACTGFGTCEVTMSAAKSVGAKFDLIPTPKHALSVTKSGTGTGKVTSSPSGIDCGATCSAEFDQGTEVTLTPSASAGSEFKEWTGACTGSGTCKVTMSAAKSVGAKFDLAPKPKFTLTIAKAGTGSGSVSCNGGACAASYDEGTTITLAASAAAGSSFSGWSGAGCSGTGTCIVTLNANTTVTATFTADPQPPVTNPPVVNPPVIPPPAPQCVVPKLAKKTLSQAKAALKAANCALGKVTKPKKKGPLVVKSSKPGANTTHPAGSKVDLKLGPKPNSKKR
jgi:List-Bact-rpt repeat protein/PASTA domain-containing protein